MIRPPDTAAAVLLLIALIAPPRAPAGEEDAWLNGQVDPLIAFYRDLHAHPELSSREVRTARRLADELARAGARVTTGVGGHGVVGVLANGAGPTVLVRADMDALPVLEATGLPYASLATDLDDEGQVVHVMHACGHDMHMTCLVGTARWLADHRDRWSGTVLLIGQPAEERARGAARMLDDGLYTRFPRPDYALALHVDSELAAGTIGYRSGPVMAGAGSVDVVVRGRGGGAGRPEEAVDPIALAAELVVDLQTIAARERDPIEPAVVSVGSVHGGSGAATIPDEVRLGLTLRSFHAEARDRLIAAITRKAEGLAEARGAPAPTVEYGGGISPVVNTPTLVARVVPAFQKALGPVNVIPTPPTMLAEDFGLFGEGGVPTFLFRLGTVRPERLARAQAAGTPLPSLHSGLYQPDAEPSLRTGIRAMTAAVVELLPPRARPAPSGGSAPE